MVGKSRELDADLLPHFDKQFVAIYNKVLKKNPKMHEMSVGAAREAYELAQLAQGKPAKLAGVKDYTFKTEDGYKLTARVFTPLGTKPKEGWPTFVWYHGGGFVVGSINTDYTLCTRWAANANCVVISLDYRHAPEYVFPTAVDDAWAGFQWVHSNAAKLRLDANKVAIGGCSAGGNLAANVTHKMKESQLPPIVQQVLLVPSLDNSNGKQKYGTIEKLYNTTGLEIKDMVWFGAKYFPNPEMREHVKASPIKYDDFTGLPPAFILVAEMDMLSGEAIAYHEKLQKNGIHSQLKVYEGCPHTFIGFSRFMKKAKEAVKDMSNSLASTFYPSNSSKL